MHPYYLEILTPNGPVTQECMTEQQAIEKAAEAWDRGRHPDRGSPTPYRIIHMGEVEMEFDQILARIL